MSITKRFFVFVCMELMIAVAIAALIITWIIRESPAIVQKTDVVRSEIISHFAPLGYEEDYYLGWSRTDPLNHVDSNLYIWFYNLGALEGIRCETGYINTQSASAIYADMEATIQAMGGNLESQKEDVMGVIDEIRSDKSARTSGNLENIQWVIESNTYSDGQGGKVRYVCFTAHAAF